jgi:hypothetical protein
MQSGGSAAEDVEMSVVVQGAGRIRHGQAPQDGSRFDVENGDRLIESDGELSACSGYGGDLTVEGKGGPQLQRMIRFQADDGDSALVPQRDEDRGGAGIEVEVGAGLREGKRMQDFA